MAVAGIVTLLARALVAICVLLGTVAADSADVVKVTTPLGLKRAIDGGAAHIHITAHLDLSSLALVPDVDYPVHFRNPLLLQSLTVRSASMFASNSMLCSSVTLACCSVSVLSLPATTW